MQFLEKNLDPKEGPDDLTTYRYFVNINLFELKQDKIDINAVMQAHRYKTAITQIMEFLNGAGDIYEYQINCILIGSKIEKDGDFVFLYNNLRDTKIFTYNYELQGLQFTEQSKSWHKPSFEPYPHVDDLTGVNHLSILKFRSYSRLQGLKLEEEVLNG